MIKVFCESLEVYVGGIYVMKYFFLCCFGYIVGCHCDYVQFFTVGDGVDSVYLFCIDHGIVIGVGDRWCFVLFCECYYLFGCRLLCLCLCQFCFGNVLVLIEFVV